MTKTTWDNLVFESPYLAVVTAKQLLQEGQMTEAYSLLESSDIALSLADLLS